MKKSISLLFVIVLTISPSLFAQDSSYYYTLSKVINNINNNKYQEALVIIDSKLNKEQLILANNPDKKKIKFLAKTYGFKGQLEWLLDKDYSDIFFKKSIEYAKVNNDSITIGKCFLNLGRIYETKSDYPKSIKYYINSLPYVKKDCGLLSRTLDNIGYSLSLLKKYDKAHEYIQQAFTVVEQCDNKFQKVFIYNSIAAFYLESKKNEDSISYYLDKAYLLATKIKHLEGLSITHSNYSDYYIQNKKYKEAIKHCKFSLDESVQFGDIESQAQSLLQLGVIFFNLNQNDKAIDYYEQALLIFEQIESHSLKADALFNLSESYKSIGNYEDSYNYYKQYIAIHDSLHNLNKIKEFNNTLIKYETNKIKAEKVLIEKENIIYQNNIEKNRIYFITLIIVFIFTTFLLVVIGVYINSRKKAKLVQLELADTKNRLQMEKKLRKAEIKSIRSQMSPHFIFNAINSIQALILNKDYENAYKYLNLFSNLIRNTLTFSEKDFISIEVEVSFIKSYLDLEFLRFNQDLTYQINDKNIPLETLLPSIIIQPFIENSIKHGLFHKKGNKELVINFTLVDNNFITCEIIDNGIGRIEAEKIKQRQEFIHTSFSTEAIDRRIKILQSFYGPKVNYNIIDLVNQDGSSRGTKISITLPIKTKKLCSTSVV